MKIQMTMTLEVDEEAWAENYVLDPKVVRDDVKMMVPCWIDHQLGIRGVFSKDSPGRKDQDENCVYFPAACADERCQCNEDQS